MLFLDMRQSGGGSIVNVTAVLLAKPPPASSLPTSVSRAAGMALTKAMSKYVGDSLKSVENLKMIILFIGCFLLLLL